MNEVSTIDHPLVQQGLSTLRDHRTNPERFRQTVESVALLMAYEATRTLSTKPIRLTTPITRTHGRVLRREVILVPILRAGLGMLNGFLRVLPNARVGFIGMKRNETTLKPTAYLESLPPDLARFDVFVLDPMLATAGSAVAALKLLRGRGAKHIRLVNLLAAPTGIERVHKIFPNLAIFIAALDPTLNKKGFIVPGLGDAGDRLFGV